MKKILFIVAGVFISFPVFCFALNVDSHKKINDHIAGATINGFSLGSFLRNQLDMPKGNDTKMMNSDNKTVQDWLSDGGVKEDNPYWLMTLVPVRAMYHFHDPFNEQGWAGKESAVFWTQEGIGQQWYGGYYSWFDVRQYYYDALIEEDNAARDVSFAETFRGLGQLMHLVQDMSVPEHARNDFHNPSEYEEWVKGSTGGTAHVNIGSYTPHSFDWDLLLLDSKFISSAPVPIANLFDTNQYEGSNPNPDITMVQGIGLAEYTNANFLSPDTIFTGYPYPSITTSVEVDNDTITDPRDPFRQVLRQYYKKIADGDTGYRLANRPLLCDYALTPVPPEGWAYNLPVFDDNVYRDYANKLLPYAIGYSADLLHYFFRGKLEISQPSRFVYSILDGSQPYKVFHYIQAKVKNASQTNGTFEEIGGGTLVAVAKYRLRTDTDPYNPDLSKDPPTDASRDSKFSYSVSAPKDINSLPTSGDGEEFEFDFSLSPIPAGITDLYVQVVYQGTLGNEEGTAIAVGMKDLSEPTHYVEYNATDRLYVSGIVRTTQEIIDNATARSSYFDDCSGSEVDYTQCAPCIYPFELKTRLAFGRYLTDGLDEEYDVVINPQPEGSYSRIIFLTDEPSIAITINKSTTASYPCTDPAASDFPLTSYSSIDSAVNQEDEAGAFYNTPSVTFRQIRSHDWRASAMVTPDGALSGIVDAPWPPLDGSIPVAFTINK